MVVVVTVVGVVVVFFSWHAKISGVGSMNHSQPALFFFFQSGDQLERSNFALSASLQWLSDL